MGNSYKEEPEERENITAGQMCFTHLELLPSIPCPFPAFLPQELPPFPLWQGLWISCHTPFSLPFSVLYYPLSLLHVRVLQSSSVMRFIFFLLLLKTRSHGSLYQQLLFSNPQITEKEKLEFKENNRFFGEFFME